MVAFNPSNKIIIIKRQRITEVDRSITELLTRGYELLERGTGKENITTTFYWARLKYLK